MQTYTHTDISVRSRFSSNESRSRHEMRSSVLRTKNSAGRPVMGSSPSTQASNSAEQPASSEEELPSPAQAASSAAQPARLRLRECTPLYDSFLDSVQSAEQPAEQWSIWPSSEQVEVPKHKQTHTRPLPLQFTIDGWIRGSSCHGQYTGHGNSKVVYRLTNGLILKLCKNRDQEPRLFEQLLALGVYPKVHASGQCSTVSSAGQPAEMWQAWLSDYAKPLDQILKEFPAASKICIPGAIRAMVKAHAGGHILSDNALFNFGMVEDGKS